MATAVRLRIAFRLHTLTFLLPRIGNTCKSHVDVHGHSDKIHHEHIKIQGNFPRKSLATEAAHSLRLHLQNLLPLLLAMNIEQLRTVPTLAMGTYLLNIYVF